MELAQTPTRLPATSHRFNDPFTSRSSLSRKGKATRFSLVVSKLEEWKSGNRMFILGIGYVGQFLAQELKQEGWVVSGTCTSLEKKKKIEPSGFDVHQFDARDPDLVVLSRIKGHTHLLVSIPPGVPHGDPMLEHEEIWRSSLMGGDLKWLCYLSTTSIYGDCGGAWVDEDYPSSPSSESAQLRLAAEDGWLRLGHDLKVSSQIFRLGGIYGPGRSLVDTILKDKELSGSQRNRMAKQYTSRVHVADICQALKASVQKPACGIYNIVDDDSSPRNDVFTYARDLVNQKWPERFTQMKPTNPSQHQDIHTGTRKGEKRVSNARMKNELGVKLLYPSYRSGLQSIVDQLMKH